jgi:hypothetical protein
MTHKGVAVLLLSLVMSLPNPDLYMRTCRVDFCISSMAQKMGKLFFQLMELINFHCNWKTMHHRNFMGGLGQGVIIINDEIVCLWQYDYI